MDQIKSKSSKEEGVWSTSSHSTLITNLRTYVPLFHWLRTADRQKFEKILQVSASFVSNG
jgi:hypothetical protein